MVDLIQSLIQILRESLPDAVGTLIATAFLALIALLCRSLKKQSSREKLKELFRRASSACQWFVHNWQLVIALALLGGVAYGVLNLMPIYRARDLVAIILLAAILLVWYCVSMSTDPRRERFVESFQRDTQQWEYEGEWHTEQSGNERILTVTKSGIGGIAKPCLSWTDCVFEFETRIVHKFTSWIIRARDLDNYVMLQCQQRNLYPHFRLNGGWANLDWTKQNPVSLPVALSPNTWFGVRIEVRNVHVMVTLIVDGTEWLIPYIPSPLLVPPIAPAQYLVGSIGFRESSSECAQFRNILVTRI